MQTSDKFGSRHHWVSQTILEQFKDSAGRLHVYDLTKHEWKNRDTSKEKVCSGPNFNGMRINGQNQVTLEGEISRVENAIPEIRKVLREAAEKHKQIALGKLLHENMLKLLTCQRLGSISGKANLTRQALERINLQISREDKVALQEEWGITGPEIFSYANLGKRAVPVGYGWVQMLYQQAFRQAAPNRMAEYRKYHWSVAVPKGPFPISDQMPSEVEDGNQKILVLPLAPQLLLLGHTEEGNPEGTDLIQRIALARTDEEKLKALICGSGILEVVANQNDMDIPILHTRTSDNHWPKISRPDWMVEAGREEAKDIMLTMIDESLYNSLLRTLARNEGEPDPGNAFETMHDVKAPVQAREKPGKTTEETERG